MNGYIKLHRVFKEWEWYTDPNMVLFFVHCLLRASHKHTSWKGIDLMPGQFISGRKQLSAETGLSEQQVRTCIEKLKSTKELTSKATNKNTVFTVNSWKKYQIDEDSNQQNNQQITNEQPANNQQITTIKKVKEGKECKEGKENNFLDSFPDEMRTEEFEQTWEEWEQHRKEKRNSLTKTSVKKQVNILKKYSPEEAIKIIEKSIANGWTGLFEPKDKQTPQKKPQIEPISQTDLDKKLARLSA